MISRRVRWVEHVGCMRGKTNAYRILVGMLEKNRSVERLRLQQEANIKMNLTEVECLSSHVTSYII
jgi:hypothetical protein